MEQVPRKTPFSSRKRDETFIREESGAKITIEKISFALQVSTLLSWIETKVKHKQSEARFVCCEAPRSASNLDVVLWTHVTCMMCCASSC